MARIRSIKPEFWTSEQVAECSTNARLLFVGLWNFADDGGVHPASAKQLKMEVFPGDTFTLEQIVEWITELRKVGLLAQYQCSEGRYWWAVTGWHHQRIDRPSIKYPPPQVDDNSPTVLRPFDERSTNARPGVEWSGEEGSGEEGSGEEGNGESPVVDESMTGPTGAALSPVAGDRKHRTPADDIDAVVEHYRALHPQARPGAKERAAIAARLRDGYSVGDLCEAVDGCHKTPHNLGANERGTKFLALELICRTSDQVARFIENDRNPPRPRNEREQRTLDAAASWLARKEAQDARSG